MSCEGGLHGGREHGDPILGALAVPDDDQVRREVDILDPEACAFEQAQAGAVEEQRQAAGDALEVLEDGSNLVAGHDDGQVVRAPGADEVVEPGQVLIEHLPVEEQPRPERLILGGGGDPPVDDQRGEELGDLRGPHLGGVALAMEKDVRLIQPT